MNASRISAVQLKSFCLAAGILLAIPSIRTFAETKPPAKPAVAKPAAKPAAARPGAAAGRPESRPGAGGAAAARPGAGVTRGPRGESTVRTADGREFSRGANGRVTNFRGANGHEARFGGDGRVREVHANGMTIRHGPGGSRRVMVDRPDHSRMVVEGRGRGYIQRPYSYRGQAYFHRTYYYHGEARSGFYRPYYYHGAYLQRYAVYHYYPGPYYGWAYASWAAPVPYGWGWGAAPWYGYYGAYFVPYPVYPSPAFWLTDYLISASLAQAYQAQMEAGQSAGLTPPRAHLVYAAYTPGGNAPLLTPEVKQAISNEIQQDIQAEQAEAASGGGGDANGGMSALVLDDGRPHVFVVSAGLVVPDSTGQECNLTESDVITLRTPPAGAAATDAGLQVLASKAQDCAKGAVVVVKLEDLQEMRNQLLTSMDQGLSELHSKAGTGGLPALPAGAQAAGSDAAFVSAAPPADPDGAAQLDQQAQQAAQTEQQVLAEATPPPDEAGAAAGGTAAPAAAAVPPAAPTVTIALGQTPAQVTASKGQPKQIVNLGVKQIYVYPDMKIIFKAGKVSDVQ